jgi:hypothetical protein
VPVRALDPACDVPLRIVPAVTVLNRGRSIALPAVTLEPAVTVAARL